MDQGNQKNLDFKKIQNEAFVFRVLLKENKDKVQEACKPIFFSNNGAPFNRTKSFIPKLRENLSKIAVLEMLNGISTLMPLADKKTHKPTRIKPSCTRKIR